MLMMYEGNLAPDRVVDNGYASSVGSISFLFHTLIVLSLEHVTRYVSSNLRFRTDSPWAFSSFLIIRPVENCHIITLQSLPPDTTRSCEGRSSNCKQRTDALCPTKGG